MADDRPADILTRLLLAASAVAGTIGLAIWITGGGIVEIGGLEIGAHRAPRFLIAAAAAVAIALALSVRRCVAALEWWWRAIERRGEIAALAVAAMSAVIAFTYGTYAAGGSDSYCYLNQAELLAAGRIRDVQPLAVNAPWPEAVAMVVPPGHIPAFDGSAAVVPMCPAGYPLMMSAARRLGGRDGMFWVVPLLGAVTVWLTFLIGRRLTGTPAGLMAAAWLAMSAAFLHQTLQPMSDVPAAAFWALALYFAVGPRVDQQRPLAAGMATGVAIMIRPNLAPLAAIVAGLLAFHDRRQLVRIATRFALGVLPGFLAVLALQNAAYGSPFLSGYGNLSGLFRVDHVLPNLSRYPVWLVATQTPVILLALAAPWLAARDAVRSSRWLLLFAIATAAMYVPYMVFDGWWYLRFLLPAYPALLVLVASVVARILQRLPVPTRATLFGTVAAVGAIVLLHLTIAHGAFRSRDFEQRYRDAGAYVAARLPPNAVVIGEALGGAVRFFSGRPTLNWRPLDPAWLDRMIADLRSNGHVPFVMLEADEEREFRAKFSAASRVGTLEWPPKADIDRKSRVYDPADLDRLDRGEPVRTEHVPGGRRR